MRRVRREVFHKDPLCPILLGRVPARGQAAEKPRVRAKVPGRPREASPLHGALEGVCRNQKGQEAEGQGEEAGAANGRPRHSTRAVRRAEQRQADGVQAVRRRLCAVWRHRQPYILQGMHGQDRQGCRQGADRTVQRVRQGVFHEEPHRPLLLGPVQHRGQEAKRARQPPQEHGRPRKARRGGGAHQGMVRRPEGQEGRRRARRQRRTRARNSMTRFRARMAGHVERPRRRPNGLHFRHRATRLRMTNLITRSARRAARWRATPNAGCAAEALSSTAAPAPLPTASRARQRPTGRPPWC